MLTDSFAVPRMGDLAITAEPNRAGVTGQPCGIASRALLTQQPKLNPAVKGPIAA